MNAHRFARRAIAIAIVLFGAGSLIPIDVRGSVIGQPSRSPIRIGVILALTGVDATGASPVQRYGVTLAVREVNAHGGIKGRPLKLVYFDDQSTPAGGVIAFERLAKDGGITAVIGPANAAINVAMAASVTEAGIPVVFGSSAPRLNHEGAPWVFSTLPSSVYGLRTLSTFTVNTLHKSKVAVLYTTGGTGPQGNAAFLADLKALGVTPVFDQAIDAYASDLTAQVAAIKKSGATTLINITAGIEDLLLLARQIHEIGLHITWVGNANMGVLKLVRQGGPLLYGTYAVTSYSPEQSPEALALHRKSEAAFHYPGDFVSACAYDGVKILAMVMRKEGTSPQAIRRGILAIRGYRGAMGTYNFNKYGEGLRQETVVRNVRGHLHVIKVLSF